MSKRPRKKLSRLTLSVGLLVVLLSLNAWVVYKIVYPEPPKTPALYTLRKGSAAHNVPAVIRDEAGLSETEAALDQAEGEILKLLDESNFNADVNAML